MTKIALTGGAYQARSVLASAQRCVNLYPESAPPESQPPVPVVHYPTPGLRLMLSLDLKSVLRGLWRATTGDLFAVCGPNVYYITADWAAQKIGTVTDLHTPVSMADNGDVLVIVDGTAAGYAIDLTTRTFGAIVDAAFFGGISVQYLDTYFVFDRPGTRQLYISLSQASYAMLTGGTGFDPLDIAAKTGSADKIVSLSCVHRELWVIGELSTEIWVDTGAADFAFGPLPGAFIDHGCVAKYSVARQDLSVFWLSQDREGRGIVVQGMGYEVKRISTHAIEKAIQSYAVVEDAIGYCYQIEGHAFYVVTFPTQDKSWSYELKTGQWHELAWADANGGLHRHRANCCTFAYGLNLVGDWQNGNIYALDQSVFTDDGRPILRIRTFPHMVNDAARVTYSSFIAYMQAGTLAGTSSALGDATVGSFDGGFDSGFPSGVVDLTQGAPMISLRWSDNGGASYGNPVMRSIGAAGEYQTQAKWMRLGMARDRVFEISWSAPINTALLGAFVEVQPHRS